MLLSTYELELIELELYKAQDKDTVKLNRAMAEKLYRGYKVLNAAKTVRKCDSA
jgi:hypothetical protein